MTEITAIDYPTVAISLLVEHFKDSTELQSLLSVMTEAAIPLQTAVLEIRDRFVLTTATGPELNIIGAVWDEARESESDNDYRHRITVKISLSVSGTIPEIKRTLFVLYEATYATYVEAYPAGFHIDTDANVNISQAELERLLPAGVFGLLWPVVDEGNYIIDSDDNFLVDSRSYPIIDSDV